MAFTGNRATVAFSGGITFASGVYTRIEFDGDSIEALDDSDLSSIGYATKVPTDLKEPGTATLTMWHKPGKVPTKGTPGTLTITYRVYGGETTPASVTGSGFISQGTAGQIANNELQQSTIVFQFDGKGTDPTYTEAVGA